MSEKIEIYYRPVGGYENFDHTFLLYTNSDGEKFIFSGMPESQADDLDYKGDWDGRLWTHCEPLTQDSYDEKFTRNQAESVEKYTITEGIDLSKVWNSVKYASEKINQANIGYGYIFNNSNSAVNTAVAEAGYVIPEKFANLFLSLGNLNNLAETYHGGDDTLVGSFDRLRIDGYGGHDTVDYSGAQNGITGRFSAGRYKIYSWEEGSNSLYNIESVIGTSMSDNFTFYDTQSMLAIEYIDGGGDADSLLFSDIKEALVIDLEAGTVKGQTSGITIIVENFENAKGGEGNDVLLGTDGANVLSGGEEGNDLLVGGDGDDTLYGGDGNDTLRGGGGNDRLWGGRGDDTLNGGDGDDTLYDDSLFGGAGNDRLNGGSGNDRIYADHGDDIIDGGDGDDRILCTGGYNTATGGAGKDVFTVYGDETTLLITDFDLSSDKLHFKGYMTSVVGTQDGLRCTFHDGATAILEGITLPQVEAAGWVL